MAKKHGKNSRLSIEDLTDEDAIFRAVRNKCLQSPLTILPLALAGGLLLLSLAFGLGFSGIFAAVVLGIVSGAAFVYNLWIRGEQLTRKHIQWLMQQLKEDRRTALSEVAEMCREIEFSEGAKEAAELSEAYSKYTEFLETRAGAKLGSAVSERITLAESARKAGIQHLRQAAEIHLALSHVEIDQLKRELFSWKIEFANKKTEHTALESKIRAHTQQIDRYNELALKRDKHIAQANELEAALMNAFMSEAGRSDLALDKSSDNPAKRLSNIIAATEAAEKDIQGFLDDIQREPSITS